MSEAADHPKIQSTFRQTVPLKLSDDANLLGPSTLYLHVDGHVEWSFFHGHAWGRASVSSDPGGQNAYQVQNLSLHITMDTPERQDRTERGNNAAIVDGSVEWASTGGGVFSGPHSVFTATASDPTYGTWSNTTTVY